MSRPGSINVSKSLQLVVFVYHLEGDGTSQRSVLPRARQYFDAISFDSLPPTPAVAALSTAQFHVDRVGFKLHASGEPVHDSQQGFAVRLASRPIAQHASQ